jgi:hypothetical protein
MALRESSVYDPGADKEHNPTEHPHVSDDDLRDITGVDPEEEADMDQAALRHAEEGGYYNDSGDDDEEEASDESAAQDKEPAGRDGLYNADDRSGGGILQRGKDKLGSIGSSQKKWVIGIVASVGGVSIIALVLLLMLASFLKIPQLGAHIAEYEFARVLRQSVQTSQNITEEKVALDATDGGVYDGVKQKYQNLRNGTWGKLDKYRPDKVIKNMNGANQMNVNYEEKPDLLGRYRLKSVSVGESEYFPSAQGKTRFVPGLSQAIDFKNKVSFAQDVQPALSSSLKANDIGPIIRGRVSKQIRQELGIGLIAWSVGKYTGKDEAKARLQEVRDAHQAISEKDSVSASDAQVKDGVEAANSTLEEDLNDDKATQAIIDNGGSDPNVESAIEKAITPGGFDSTIKAINPVFNAAMAFCIVYEGSMVDAAPTINGQTDAQQRAFYYTESAADQEKSGHTTGEAVGAFNAQLGDFTSSNPEVRATGGRADTGDAISSQASATGDYTMVNILPLGSVFDGPFRAACPVLANPFVGASGAAVLAGAQLIPGFGEAEDAAVAAADEATASVTSRVLSGITSKFASKEAAKETVGKAAAKTRFIVSDTAKTGAKLAGASILAKLVVMSKSMQLNNGLEQNADFANMADSGGNINSNEVMRKQYYGRPLDQPETAGEHTADMKYLADQNAKESTYNRYIAISNPDSLLNKAAVLTANTVQHSFITKFASMTGKLFDPVGSLNKIFGTFLTPKTLADATVTNANTYYGNVQQGFSAAEMNLLKTDDSYKMLENQRILDDSGQYDAIEAKFNKCYTDKIGDLLARGDIQRDKEGNVTNDDNIADNDHVCAPNDLGLANSTFGPQMVFRWRVAHSYSNGLDHLIDQQEVTADDPGSASQPTAAAGADIDTANLFKDSTGVACAANTKDLGVEDGYTSGHVVKIRICAVSNIPGSGQESNGGYGVDGADGKVVVNSRVSGAVYAMGEAAKKDGVNLTANSGFRTMSHQEALCPCNGITVARPGYSNHQMGLAIDFGGGLPSTPGPISGNQFWDWLSKNASKFGYKNYPREAWHWSPTGN